MNIQNRYDSCLSDVMTLLQEAVYRFIADRKQIYQFVVEVDLTKFFQYFKQFHRNLVSLENNIHPNKTKFSRYLSKIHQLSQQIDFKLKEKTISLEPQQKTFYKTANSKSLKGETTSKKSNTIDKTQELNVIGQIEEKQDFDDIKLKFHQDNRIKQGQSSQRKRVGTAQGLRQKMSVTIDFHNSRPYTGSHTREKLNKSLSKGFDQTIKDRYKSLTKYEKTINDSIQNDFPQPSYQQVTEKKIFNLGQRKSIYDVLEQEKKLRKDYHFDEQFLKSGLIKLPEKKKNKNWSRWSFKINKLL